MKFFERSIKIILLIALGLFSYRFCNKKTGGFSILAIHSDRPFDARWQTRALTPLEQEEFNKAINQPYHYLFSGGQVFVFLSSDSNYVIKLFKERILTQPCLLNTFPFSKLFRRYCEKRNWKRHDKLERDFTSYQIAFDELQEETALLFVHLNPTQDIQKKLLITDKLAIKHEIDLDKVHFVVQKRAELVYDRMTALIHLGQIEEAKEALSQILNLILVRCKKGLRDRDPEIASNCGFVENRAIKIDVGRLMRCEEMKKPEMYQQEVRTLAIPLQMWLADHAPILSSHLDEQLKLIENQ